MRAVLPCQGRGDKEHVEVRPQSVQFKCDRDRVAQLVGDFYKAVTPIKGKVEYDEQEVAGYLEELYDMLIKPIWSAVATGLQSKSTLVFVPDKVENSSPFLLDYDADELSRGKNISSLERLAEMGLHDGQKTYIFF